MIWDINTGYLKPLLSENPEEESTPDAGGSKSYGF